MKTRTKVLGLMMAAVLLVSATIFGTMAYLTDTKSVTNTFTVGKVAITLDEAKVNEMGKPVNNDGAEVGLNEAPRVSENTYKLMPGHTYVKDPTIKVASGSEDCWLFVKVENELGNNIEGTSTIADQLEAKGWKLIDGTSNIYGRDSTNAAGSSEVVFDNFTISGEVNNAALAGYAGKTVKVTAYAVQADGFTTASAAWNATFGNN